MGCSVEFYPQKSFILGHDDDTFTHDTFEMMCIEYCDMSIVI